MGDHPSLLSNAVALVDIPRSVRSLARHLQRTYSARETGVMQELEKHNLTRITNAPAEVLIQNFRASFLC